MSTASEQAAALRRQAAALDDIGKLEEKSQAAKAAYQDDPGNEKLKTKHRAAATALADARNLLRPQPAEQGDAAVTPAAANGAANPGKVV